MKILRKSAVPFLTSVVLLSGCSTVLELPNDGPTTMSVYRDHIGAGSSPAAVYQKDKELDEESEKWDKEGEKPPYLTVDEEGEDRDVETHRVNRLTLDRQEDLPSFSRANLSGDIKTRFPKLPNVEFTMFVFPHISERSGVTIPLYATNWMLYEKTHYAKPGEVVIRK